MAQAAGTNHWARRSVRQGLRCNVHALNLGEARALHAMPSQNKMRALDRSVSGCTANLFVPLTANQSSLSRVRPMIVVI